MLRRDRIRYVLILIDGSENHKGDMRLRAASVASIKMVSFWMDRAQQALLDMIIVRPRLAASTSIQTTKFRSHSCAVKEGPRNLHRPVDHPPGRGLGGVGLGQQFREPDDYAVVIR